MGGTSTDVSAYDGDLPLTYEASIAGITITEPQVAIHTIAAGGGSVLAFADGRLKVGPASAGADPGPAAYRKGGPLTVTDANLVLGRLPAAALPAVFGPNADQPADVAAARGAMSALAATVAAASGRDHTAADLAAGFIDIAVEQMANAIRQITMTAGRDPADYTLAVFGGAGAQHCCAVAERIGVRRIWIHPLAGVLSALGVGLAQHKRSRTSSVEAPLDTCAGDLVARADALLAGLQSQWADELGDFDSHVFAGLRFGRSNAVIDIELADAAELAQSFRTLYQRRYGHVPDDAIEVAYLRADLVERNTESINRVPAFTQGHLPATTPVYDGTAMRDVPLLDSATLASQGEIAGPAVVVDAHTTLWLAPGWNLASQSDGAWLLEQTGATRRSAVTDRDPHLLEVFNGRFMAVAERMGKTLERTAQSVNIRERLDYSCAVFDASGRLLANAPHMPVHLGSMSESVQVATARFGANAGAGDVWVLNSPYDGGTHLPDITVVAPWFSAAGNSQFFRRCPRASCRRRRHNAGLDARRQSAYRRGRRAA